MSSSNGRGAGQGAPNQQPDSVQHSTHRHRRLTCRYHCRTCNAHFSSLDGFDQHRLHDECHDPSVDDAYVPAIGTCKISGRQELGGTIWRLGEAAARVQRRFDRSEDSALGAVA